MAVKTVVRTITQIMIYLNNPIDSLNLQMVNALRLSETRPKMKCIALSRIFGSVLIISAVGMSLNRSFPEEISHARNSRMLTLGQLSEPFQLLSQYSYGAIRECPKKFQMDIKNSVKTDNTSGAYNVPYSDVNIELDNWRSSTSEGPNDQISCSGPSTETVLTLQPGVTVSAPEFIRLHSHSSSTLTLFKSLISRFRTGNYWLSAPKVSPFRCSKNGHIEGGPWFAENFTFIFFCEQESIPIAFIGKVRPDGSERVVHLNLTGTIRYFIATAAQTTCIYRSVNDVKRYEAQRKKTEWETTIIVSGSVTPEPSSSVYKRVSPHVPQPTASMMSTQVFTDYSTTFPSPSCECSCSKRRQKMDGNKHLIQGELWYNQNSSDFSQTEQKFDHFRNWAPYIPQSPFTRKLDASINPSRSWRWSWFWCSEQSTGAPYSLNHETEEVKIWKERSCFPSSARVETLKRGFVRMQDLKIGDEVRVGPGKKFSRVFAFSHADFDVFRSFVSITTASGYSVTISGGHLVPVDHGELIRADNIKVGSTVTTLNSSFDTVTAITAVKARGLFNPHTLSGTIFVDGVLTSCYTAAVAPSVATALLSPIRSVANLLHFIKN